LLQPSSFAPLGQLPDESGIYSINTSGSTPVMTLPDGSKLSGVLDPSGQFAVFTFNSVQLDNAWITATGSRPVALLSQGNMTLNSTGLQLSASGFPSFGSAQNIPGAGGGAASWPVGPLSGGPGYPGGGPTSGGGGGFGGAGGAGGPGYFSTITPGPYGPISSTFNLPGGHGGGTYGGASTPFEGGSAGGYGSAFPPSAGAGGGAIELGAQGSLQLLGTTVMANGGNGGSTGGGGSGGSISLLGTSVSLLGTQLFAMGGDGGPGTSWGGFDSGALGAGGGGGGGIIDIQGQIVVSDFQTFVSGGTGYTNGQDGEVFTNSVPEPSSFALASIVCLAGLGYGRFRCRGSSRRSAAGSR
jgi:hypothetical protein